MTVVKNSIFDIFSKMKNKFRMSKFSSISKQMFKLGKI